MIRAATTADLPRLAEYLAERLRGDGGPARYHRYLDYRWLADKPDIGVLIEDDGEIRGFIGAIYAFRESAAATVSFCNLTSIAVDESHRKLTLQLFNALFKRKELSITCFSASDRIAKILEFFKFTHRPSDRVVATLASSLRGLRHLRDVDVVTDLATLATELDPVQRKISQDHAPYRCAQVLLVRGTRRCFVVTGRRGRGVKAFADVLYASDPELLVELLPFLHAPLFAMHRTALIGIDQHWVKHRPFGSFVYRKLRPTYWRSTAVSSVDLLYSEAVPLCGYR